MNDDKTKKHETIRRTKTKEELAAYEIEWLKTAIRGVEVCRDRLRQAGVQI